MDFHPAADIFPLLEGDGFQALKADIAEHGQLDPIWIYQNQILDGRNRYRACQELNIETATNAWSGTDPLKFVLSMNLHRRQLTAGQRAFVAVEVEKYLAVEAKRRQGSRTDIKEIFPECNGQARDQAVEKRWVFQAAIHNCLSHTHTRGDRTTIIAVFCWCSESPASLLFRLLD